LAVVAIVLAGLLAGCGSTPTTLGSPQTIPTALPSRTTASAGTNFPAINTRFVVPHLSGERSAIARAYIVWTVASSLSLRSGRMDPRVKRLSSAAMYDAIQTQVQKYAQYTTAASWGPIVQRVDKVELTDGGASMTVCTSTTDKKGKKSKQGALVEMHKHRTQWQVTKVYHLSVKLPHC